VVNTGGYQLTSKWDLISGRYPYNQLNGIDDNIKEIQKLTPTEADKAKKKYLAEMVALMNNRGLVRFAQRAEGEKELMEDM
jgi:hypothetical protein